jgi:hypothetical protein
MTGVARTCTIQGANGLNFVSIWLSKVRWRGLEPALNSPFHHCSFPMKNALIHTAVALCFAVGAGQIAAINPGPRPAAAAQGGLQISLTTSGYKFIVGDAPAGGNRTSGNATPRTSNSREPLPAIRDSFAVSAILTNRSNSDIPFVFDNPIAAEQHFKFRVLDAAGKEVWVSTEVPSDGPTTEDILSRRSAWRRTVLVPLKIEDAPLAPGRYTLEAILEADNPLAASLIFEVAAPPDPDGKLTGITGQVLQAINGPEAGAGTGAVVSPIAERVVANARIVITEILDSNTPVARAPFFWQGVTNAEGRFQTNTPPGRFRVMATLPPASPTVATNILPGPVQSKTIEVRVEAGQFSEVTFHFPAVQPPPPVDSGIRGLVLIGPIRPVEQPGEPNEAPLAGAQIRVEEIPLPNVRYIRAMFVWSGVTNGEGRFTVRTPPGKFKVTARQGLVVVDPPPGAIQFAANTGLPGTSATAEVVVEEHAFTNVTLHLDSGIR